ncbi:hypothetical protein MVES_002807 [Malassezia vespertilionis]|uniref:Ribosomal RNA methyltransferase FtsJ domain-containing protein n=1 Tax=Malassezia vespertilionis TaxID=2020962 RepID=A0A2N1J9R8_9BASI|nr:hypothetical protein MVES_002807 [Malassezia vespertilionis]
MGKSTKDHRDHFYRQGKQEGYRARSAYKLLQLDAHYNLFGLVGNALAHQIGDTPNALCEILGEEIGCAVYAAMVRDANRPGYVIDLCAAPGSWSQVLSRALGDTGTCIVAVDLQAMAPLQGVTQIVGDITTDKTVNAIEQAFCKAQYGSTFQLADLIVCDGAPDVTGIQPLDEYVQSQLLMAAFSMALRMLRDRGTFLAKVFVHKDGDAARLLLAQLRRFFAQYV